MSLSSRENLVLKFSAIKIEGIDQAIHTDISAHFYINSELYGISNNQDTDTQIEIPLIDSSTNLQIFLKDAEGNSMNYGSISFSHETFAKIATGYYEQWFTIFDEADDDMFDGIIGVDDEETPRVLIRFEINDSIESCYVLKNNLLLQNLAEQSKLIRYKDIKALLSKDSSYRDSSQKENPISSRSSRVSISSTSTIKNLSKIKSPLLNAKLGMKKEDGINDENINGLYKTQYNTPRQQQYSTYSEANNSKAFSIPKDFTEYEREESGINIYSISMDKTGNTEFLRSEISLCSSREDYDTLRVYKKDYEAEAVLLNSKLTEGNESAKNPKNLKHIISTRDQEQDHVQSRIEQQQEKGQLDIHLKCNQRIEEYKAMCKALNEDNTKLKNRVKELEEKLESLKLNQDEHQLNKQFHNQLKLLEDAQCEIERQRIIIENLENACHSIKIPKINQQTHQEKKRVEVSSWTEKFEDRGDNENIVQVQNAFNNLNFENLANQIDIQNDIITNLKTELQKVNKVNEDKSKNEQQLLNLQQKINELIQENQNLRNKNQYPNKKVEICKNSDSTNNNSLIQVFQNELVMKNKTIDELTNLNNELKSKYNTISEKITNNDDLVNQIQELTKQIKALELERDNLKNQYISTNDNYMKLTNKYMELTDIITKYKIKNQAISPHNNMNNSQAMSSAKSNNRNNTFFASTSSIYQDNQDEQISNEIDIKLQEFLTQQKLSSNCFIKFDNDTYIFNSKKVNLKLINGKLNVKAGASYIPICDYLKINKIIGSKGSTIENNSPNSSNNSIEDKSFCLNPSTELLINKELNSKFSSRNSYSKSMTTNQIDRMDKTQLLAKISSLNDSNTYTKRQKDQEINKPLENKKNTLSSKSIEKKVNHGNCHSSTLLNTSSVVINTYQLRAKDYRDVSPILAKKNNR